MPKAFLYLITVMLFECSVCFLCPFLIDVVDVSLDGNIRFGRFNESVQVLDFFVECFRPELLVFYLFLCYGVMMDKLDQLIVESSEDLEILHFDVFELGSYVAKTVIVRM